MRSCGDCYGRYQDEREMIPASVKALTPTGSRKSMEVDRQSVMVGEIHLRRTPICK